MIAALAKDLVKFRLLMASLVTHVVEYTSILRYLIDATELKTLMMIMMLTIGMMIKRMRIFMMMIKMLMKQIVDLKRTWITWDQI